MRLCLKVGERKDGGRREKKRGKEKPTTNIAVQGQTEINEKIKCLNLCDSGNTEYQCRKHELMALEPLVYNVEVNALTDSQCT